MNFWVWLIWLLIGIASILLTNCLPIYFMKRRIKKEYGRDWDFKGKL